MEFNHRIFKIKFGRIAYPQVIDCIKYLKKWDLYDQLASFMEDEIGSKKSLTFDMTKDHITFYLNCNHKRKVKHTAITIHHTTNTPKSQDVYYYHTNVQIPDTFNHEDPVDYEEPLGFMHWMIDKDPAKTLSTIFEKKKEYVGHYAIMNHHRMLQLTNINRYVDMIKRGLTHTYTTSLKDKRLIISRKISEKDAVWCLLENV